MTIRFPDRSHKRETRPTTPIIRCPGSASGIRAGRDILLFSDIVNNSTRANGTVWAEDVELRFRVEITGKLKSGENQLEVKVVNGWANRIIGGTKLPESQRRTRTNITKLPMATPLEPSGLSGLVRM